jgi:hypothetical protein
MLHFAAGRHRLKSSKIPLIDWSASIVLSKPVQFRNILDQVEEKILDLKINFFILSERTDKNVLVDFKLLAL